MINQFNRQARLPAALVAELRKSGLPVLDSHLSASVKMRESHHAATPLIFLAPSHRLTREFVALYDEIDGPAAG